MTQLLDGHGGAAIEPSGNNKAERNFHPRRIVLFIGAGGIVSDRLIHALELEFPWLVLKLVDAVSAGCMAFDHPVSLILVDASLISKAEQASPELMRLHPHALIALIQRDELNPASLFPGIFDFPSIRGILPMNIGLDVWLSVIRLMLCGGEYFPPKMCYSYAKSVGGGQAITPNRGLGAAVRHVGNSQIAELTAREVQILEMVSRGMQNKRIAAEFGLSEHTVKIHLHNIITKLGAHNRTEAAAKFRHFKEHSLLSTRNGHWPAS